MSKDLFEFLPKSKEEIMAHFNESEPFCVHDLGDLVKEGVFSSTLLKSFKTLEKSWSKSVDVHLPDVRDEISSVSVCVKEAFTQFRKGQTILFNDVNEEYTDLNIWLENIRKNLKLSIHSFGRCLVYATPSGGGNTAHFDQNFNFVVQVHGEKKWWLQKNQTVVNPLSRHVIGERVDPALEGYSKNQMPKDFSEELSTEYTLKPGSVLFVPRGVWHKTKALKDAMSLNFTFTAPTWAELFLTAVKGRILQSEHWRQTAADFNNVESLEKLNFLIQNLAKDAISWRAEDILKALGEVK